MMLSWKNGQISVKYLNDEFGDVGGFPFFLFRLLDEERKDSVKRFKELFGIKDNPPGLFLFLL